MISKRFVLRVLTLCLTADVTYSVWSHCHNTESWENRTSHSVSGYEWSEPNNNQVDYYVNVLHNYGKDSLVPTVTAADDKWSGIRFKGITIRFSLAYRGTTYQSPDKDASDRVNCIKLTPRCVAAFRTFLSNR